MKIGIVSDTHVETIDDIPSRVREALSQVDLIVHAGDFTSQAVLDGLRELGNVQAVCGNMDSGRLRAELSPEKVFSVGGKQIGLTHGSGSRHGIAARIRKMFDDVDIIIYGHSHVADIQTIEGTLLINPGPVRESFGILTIEDDITAEIANSLP